MQNKLDDKIYLSVYKTNSKVEVTNAMAVLNQNLII